MIRKFKNEYQEFLELEGYGKTFPKKDVRILYESKHGKILDLIVEEFLHPDQKQYLYKEYSFDIGNCLSDWNDWTFCDVLIKIFVSYEVPVSLRKKILFELSKVDEWRPEIAFWIYRNFNNYA